MTSDTLPDFQSIRDWDNRHFLHPWEGMADIGENDRTFAQGGQGIYVTNASGD